MKYMIISFLVFLYYFIISFLLGTLFIKKIKTEYSFPFALIIGCFIYFICFNCVALPMKLCFRPLSELTQLWFVGVAGAFILLILGNTKYLIEVIRNCISIVKQKPWIFMGILMLFLIQYIYIGSQTAWVIGVTDDQYYIGNVVASVSTNTIQQYEEITKAKYSQLPGSRLLQMYPVHSAVICQLTGLPALIENKWSLTAIWLLLIDCVYFLWGQFLFRNHSKKSLIFMGIVTWVVFCQRKTPGFFAMELVYRTSEGKNLLVNLIIPFLFYVFAKIVMLNGRKQEWYVLFVTVVCSFCLVMSSMFILPLVLGSFYMTYILLGKRWRMIGPATVCFLPCIVVLGIYMLSGKGILVFPVP